MKSTMQISGTVRWAVGCIAFMGATPACFAASFSDVPASHPNAEAIAYVQAKGVVSGYADGTYRPQQPINRAEFTKILIKAQATPEDIERCMAILRRPDPWGRVRYTEFADVSIDDWFVPYLCLARQNLAIEGYLDQTFRPGNDVNFAEAAKILVRTVGHQWIKNQSTVSAVWYREFVKDLEDDHAIPLSIRSFDQKVTRGEMAEMVWRLREGIKNLPSRTYDQMAEKANVDLWKTFTNKRYGYSLSYPGELIVSSEDFFGPAPEDSYVVTVGRIAIYPRDTAFFQGLTGEKRETVLRIVNLPIRDYAQALYDKNRPNSVKRTGPLEEITIAGRPAYRFTVTHDLNFEDGGMLLDNEWTVVLFTNGKFNFMARYDEKAIAANEILASLTFK